MTEQELASALFNAGLLTRQQIEAAAAERSPHKNFAQVVVEKGWVSPAQIAQIDSQAFLTLAAPNQAALHQAPPNQAMPAALDTSAFSQATNQTANAAAGQAPINMAPIPPAINASGFAPAYQEAYRQAYPQSVNGMTILVLGILGLVFCQICGPFAWIMGNNALRAIDAGLADPAERSNANVGRILGIIGTVFLVLGLIFMLLVILAVATTTPNPNSLGTGGSTTVIPMPPSP